jgi:hypothetical protein
MSDLHVFKCDAGGIIDWVVAASADDATAVMAEQSGGDWDEAIKPAWLQLPDDEEMRITVEDEGKVAKTCAEWARENGRGFLASTEY